MAVSAPTPRELPLAPCGVFDPFDGRVCTSADGLKTSGTCVQCGRFVCEQCSTRRNWGPRGARWRQRVCRPCQESAGLLRKRHKSENPTELTPDMLRAFLKVAEVVEMQGPGIFGKSTQFTERAWVRFEEFTRWAECEVERHKRGYAVEEK
jgi:hypothetical protein